VPHPSAVLSRKWDNTTLDRPFSDSAGCPQVPLLGSGNLQPFPCPLRKIIPRRRTMRIKKLMKEVAAEVEVAFAFPRSICQGSARSVPSTRYHLINTPTPPIFIFKTLQIISVPPCQVPQIPFFGAWDGTTLEPAPFTRYRDSPAQRQVSESKPGAPRIFIALEKRTFCTYQGRISLT
jgi:hypothetical protein